MKSNLDKIETINLNKIIIKRKDNLPIEKHFTSFKRRGLKTPDKISRLKNRRNIYENALLNKSDTNRSSSFIKNENQKITNKKLFKDFLINTPIPIKKMPNINNFLGITNKKLQIEINNNNNNKSASNIYSTKRRNNLSKYKTEHCKNLKISLRKNPSDHNRKNPKVVLTDTNIILSTEKNYFTKKLNEQNELIQPQNKPKNDIKKQEIPNNIKIEKVTKIEKKVNTLYTKRNMNRKKYQLKSNTNKNFSSPSSSTHVDGSSSVYSKHSSNYGNLYLQDEKNTLSINKNNCSKILNKKSIINYSSKNFEKKSELTKFSTTTKNSKIFNKQNKIAFTNFNKNKKINKNPEETRTNKLLKFIKQTKDYLFNKNKKAHQKTTSNNSEPKFEFLTQSNTNSSNTINSINTVESSKCNVFDDMKNKFAISKKKNFIDRRNSATTKINSNSNSNSNSSLVSCNSSNKNSQIKIHLYEINNRQNKNSLLKKIGKNHQEIHKMFSLTERNIRSKKDFNNNKEIFGIHEEKLDNKNNIESGNFCFDNDIFKIISNAKVKTVYEYEAEQNLKDNLKDNLKENLKDNLKYNLKDNTSNNINENLNINSIINKNLSINNGNVGKFIEDRDEYNNDFKRQTSKDSFSFKPSNNESIEIMDEELKTENNTNTLNDKKKNSNINSEGNQEHHIKIIKKSKNKKK